MLIKIRILLLIVLLNNIIFGVDSSQYIQKAIQQKEYGIAINHYTLMIEQYFKTILQETLLSLPYIKQASTTNQNYSMDIHVDNINYNILTEYSIKYNNTLPLKITLVYALEEVAFTKAYIDNIQYSNFQNQSMIVTSLQNKSLGNYLWNKSESIAYYVYSFSNSTLNPHKNSIPGLLIKIEFPKNSPYTSAQQSVIDHLISQIKWKSLQHIYMNKKY